MKRVFTTIIAMLLTTSVSMTVAQSRKAQSWFNAEEWLQGGEFSPAASIDIQEFADHYKAHPNRWNKLFSILAEEDLMSLPLESSIINENLKMNVQEYKTRPTTGKQLRYERHQKYIDVQCVVSGRELQGTRKSKFGEVIQPYSEEKDVAFYDLSDVPFYIINSGEFTIFFPDDLHTSNYGFGERTTVRKIVFKVKYD